MITARSKRRTPFPRRGVDRARYCRPGPPAPEFEINSSTFKAKGTAPCNCPATLRAAPPPRTEIVWSSIVLAIGSLPPRDVQAVHVGMPYELLHAVHRHACPHIVDVIVAVLDEAAHSRDGAYHACVGARHAGDYQQHVLFPAHARRDQITSHTSPFPYEDSRPAWATGWMSRPGSRIRGRLRAGGVQGELQTGRTPTPLKVQRVKPAGA